VRADPQKRWVRVRRGDYTLVMNFSDAEQAVPGDAARSIVLATHERVQLRPDGTVVLPALGGALVGGVRAEDAVPSAGGVL
jgi:maltooligosyltrehalose trehalohydrolase